MIVFGLNESASGDAAVRIADDLEAMQSVIGNLQVEHDITKLVRLGKTRNSSADERANVNFLYDYIVHALGNKKEKDKTNS